MSALWLALVGFRASAADLKEAQHQFLTGNYTGSIASAQQALREQSDSEEWQLLLSRGLLATGCYGEAKTAMTKALEDTPWSIRLRWQAADVFQRNGQAGALTNLAEDIVRSAMAQPRAYRDVASLVAVGQAALAMGSDPKRVLDSLFEAARKEDPKSREVFLAIGNLALDKHDFALAAKRFQEGLKQLPDDPDLHCGLAQAYAPSDPALMLASLEAALGINSNHVPSLLLLADHSLDAEDHAAAEEFLDRIQAVNPWCPEAWAYRAVLAHLQNQLPAEDTARRTALKFWPANPGVDHLIGLKLSQYYRFAEGAAHQRQALQFDPGYLPAKAQLAQDLLRLGQEQEGWRLAEEVQREDGYDVEAFNLATLHETLGKFKTLTNHNFIVRLESHEAAVYGERVLELLERARTTLSAKYGREPTPPTVVEVFSSQKDFGVRTFGMPGNPGYLGVCFGRVITANSPAAHPGHPVNWETVLWHEFCHVVTLQITHNRMPRWLSEGISVYEERQANPAWGEHMTPQYREMTLGDDLTPVSQLSGAFLAPRSSLHLQFAYYESSLVVQFIVQRFGLEQLKAILRDLGDGLDIHHALEKHTLPLDKLDTEFVAFAQKQAEDLAPGLSWDKPGEDEMGDSEGEAAAPAAHSQSATNVVAGPIRSRPTPEANEAAWNALATSQPTNFWVMSRRAEEFVEAKEWPRAKALLQKLVELYPAFIGPDSAYRLLAATHRALGETNAERQVLAQWAERDDTALDAYRRLMELGSAAQDWPSVTQNARRYLAVDPLVLLPYRFLAQASEQSHESGPAIGAYRAMLELNPPDPAEAHFRLARLLHQGHDPEARRQVLQALEEAPRYRDALRLLLEIEKDGPGGQNGT